MERESSLWCSQQPTTGPYPQPEECDLVTTELYLLHKFGSSSG